MRNARHLRHPGQRGFTLLEIMVALIVLAISMGAAIKAVSVHADNAAYLRDRTLATWVAMNKLTELRLAKDWPSLGTSNGHTLLAEREWFWTVEVIETPDGDVHRADVKVATGGDDEAPALARLFGYVGRPQ